MKRSRSTENQIIGTLQKHEAGVSVADLCRKHGVSDATAYNWTATERPSPAIVPQVSASSGRESAAEVSLDGHP